MDTGILNKYDLINYYSYIDPGNTVNLTDEDDDDKDTTQVLNTNVERILDQVFISHPVVTLIHISN